jgi:sugar phosphate permease
MKDQQMQKQLKKLYPWIIWSIAVIFLFYKYLLEVSPSVMSSELMRFFALNGEQMGNLAACYFYAYFIMQIPMGILLDRFGPRRVMTISIFLCAVGTLILSQSHLLLFAGIGRFITGIGAAVAAIGCLKLTTLWFAPNRFALMAGLMMSFGMLGAVSGEAPLAMAIDSFGWRGALLHGAMVGFILTILFWLIVRDSGHYVEMEPKKIQPTRFWHGVIDVLKRKQTWLLSLYSGLAFAPVAVFGGLWGVPFLQAAYGFSRTAAAEAVSLVFIGFAVGAPIAGWLSDRIGKRLPIIIIGTTLALFISLIVLYFPELSITMANILLFMFGFFISAFLLSFAMVREVNLLIFAATALGFMNTFDAALGAISDPILGHFLDLGWKGEMFHGARVFSLHAYHWAMCLLPLYLIISLIIVPFLKETHCRQVGANNYSPLP